MGKDSKWFISRLWLWWSEAILIPQGIAAAAVRSGDFGVNSVPVLLSCWIFEQIVYLWRSGGIVRDFLQIRNLRKSASFSRHCVMQQVVTRARGLVVSSGSPWTEEMWDGNGLIRSSLPAKEAHLQLPQCPSLQDPKSPLQHTGCCMLNLVQSWCNMTTFTRSYLTWCTALFLWRMCVSSFLMSGCEKVWKHSFTRWKITEGTRADYQDM